MFRELNRFRSVLDLKRKKKGADEVSRLAEAVNIDYWGIANAFFPDFG